MAEADENHEIIYCESSDIGSPLVRSEGEDVERESSPKLRPRRESWKGEFVKSVVETGLDAIFICFSLISSISATQRSSVYVLVVGFANLVAGGISMGLDDFVSSTTEKDVALEERKVTEREVSHHSRTQQLELLQHYQALGMNDQDATTVVNIFSKYKDILVDEEMATHKGTSSSPLDHQGETETPWMNGLASFASFVAFGTAPLLSYVILLPFTNNDLLKFIGACVFSGIAVAALGLAKAKIAGQSNARSVVGILFNAAVSAAAAYSLGWTLRNVANREG